MAGPQLNSGVTGGGGGTDGPPIGSQPFPSFLPGETAGVVTFPLGLIGVALSGPRGPLFGTRYGGNNPIFNSNETLRVGWSYIRSTGEYVFRIGGTAVGAIKSNPHINLWPPSWWGR